MSAEANAASTRQRASLACDMCRSRRTKCDGRKPTCSFCKGQGIACKLQNPSSSNAFQVTPLAGSSLSTHCQHWLKPGRNELEISAVKEHLDHISSVTTMRLLDSNSEISGNAISVTLRRFGSYPMDESIISRNWRMEFPFMTIQTPSMMCLLELNPRLAAQLVVVERTSLATLTPPSSSDKFHF